MRRIFSHVKELLEAAQPVRDRPTLSIDIAGRGRQATLPWIGFLDTRETTSAQRGVYCVYLFREDLSGLYLTLAIGVVSQRRELGADRKGFEALVTRQVTKLRTRVKSLAAHDFKSDNAIDLRATGQNGRDYALATVAYKFYASHAIPDDGLLLEDLQAVLFSYDGYLERKEEPNGPGRPPRPKHGTGEAPPFEYTEAVEDVIASVDVAGYVFEPWQIAAYVGAVRTKPFVILAGVTGTGKSRLPALIAEITGGYASLIPVRPDWTDSSDVIGYVDLQANFRPGSLLRFARQAQNQNQMHFTCVLDEMNLARVEQYLPEVLSRMEDRDLAPAGGFASKPLVDNLDSANDWSTVPLPSNMAIVGTVNMDESAHGFSRKVLDRAFTLELSEIELERWERSAAQTRPPASAWPVSAWYPRALRLAALEDISDADRSEINRVINVLTRVNTLLIHAQLQVGYRTRDEIALFVLHCREHLDSFRTRSGEAVDSLDLALHMKVLPRIIGGSAPIRRAILELLGWSVDGVPRQHEDDVQSILATWNEAGRPNAVGGASYPRTAARLCLMWDRVANEGFTSFWL